MASKNSREFKFRAWDGKRFWYFDLTDWRLDAGTLYPHDEPGEPSVDLSHTENQQYTGLKDKNGKEIFEGDITNLGVVTWFDELTWDGGGSPHPGFYFKNEFTSDGELDYHGGFDNCKVIGNIYENPELAP